MKNVIILNDKELKIAREVEEIVQVDYEIDGNRIEVENLFEMIKDLKYQYENMVYEFEEKIRDMQEVDEEALVYKLY